VAAVRLAFGSLLSQRWRSWLVLAGLVAITSGASLAALAAGARTDGAVPSLVSSTKSPDLLTVSGGPPGLGFAQVTSTQIGALPGVIHDEVGVVFEFQTAAIAGQTFTAGQNALAVVALPVGSPQPGDLAAKLVAGRLPDPGRPDEVLADYALQRSIPGLRVGSVVGLKLYTSSESQDLENGVQGPGPSLTLHVVGIDLSGISLPGGHEAGFLTVTPAFVRQEAAQALTIETDLLRLAGGASGAPRTEAALQAVPGVEPGFGNMLVISTDAAYSAIERSIHPQVVGWWTLAALAGLGAIVVLAQGLARQSAAEAPVYATMAALGMRPVEILQLGLARCLAVGVAGSVGAIALAYALSPLTPVGEARQSVTARGLVFDPALLLLGGLAIVVAVLAVGVWPCWRATRARTGFQGGGEAAAVRRPSSVVVWLSRAGGSPAALIGTRQALERGRSPSSPPAGSAIAGAVLAIAALTGTAIFGASLAHLLATPRLYGDDYSLGTPPGGTAAPSGVDVTEVLDSLVAPLPGVTQISVGGASAGTAGSATVSVLALASLKGPPLLSIVSGRSPSGPGEVALGAATMRQLHTRVGSTVVIAPVTQTVTFRVVGEASFPFEYDGATGGLGNGVAMTVDGVIAAGCPPEECTTTQSPIVFVGFARDATGRASLAKVEAEARDPNSPLFYLSLGPPSANTPTSLVNFGEAVNFPLLVTLSVVVFAVASLLHALVVGVIRRRREIGILKSLGFLRRQVGAVVTWQSVTVLVVGLIVGIPLGVAIGRGVWGVFAAEVGVVNATIVPAWQIVALAAGALVAALAISGIPAALAARLRPAQLLREV